MASPSVSSAPSAGRLPIAVGCASACPFSRSVIHFSTRLFSPKPGQANLPSAFFRNQFTA